MAAREYSSDWKSRECSGALERKGERIAGGYIPDGRTADGCMAGERTADGCIADGHMVGGCSTGVCITNNCGSFAENGFMVKSVEKSIYYAENMSSYGKQNSVVEQRACMMTKKVHTVTKNGRQLYRKSEISYQAVTIERRYRRSKSAVYEQQETDDDFAYENKCYCMRSKSQGHVKRRWQACHSSDVPYKRAKSLDSSGGDFSSPNQSLTSISNVNTSDEEVYVPRRRKQKLVKKNNHSTLSNDPKRKVMRQCKCNMDKDTDSETEVLEVSYRANLRKKKSLSDSEYVLMKPKKSRQGLPNSNRTHKKEQHNRAENKHGAGVNCFKNKLNQKWPDVVVGVEFISEQPQAQDWHLDEDETTAQRKREENIKLIAETKMQGAASGRNIMQVVANFASKFLAVFFADDLISEVYAGILLGIIMILVSTAINLLSKWQK